MLQNNNNIVLLNGDIINNEFELETIIIKSAAYEVIRVINGHPLFFKDHIDRLFFSLDKATSTTNYYANLASQFNLLIDSLQLLDGNIRIDAWFSEKLNYVMRQIPHHYPSTNDYIKGVAVATLQAERSNPNKKIWLPEIRDKADNLIKLLNIREVILVNRKNEITEGSRSNIFFIKKNQIITAPLNLVLEGITRKYVIAAIKMHNHLQFVEEAINIENINQYEAAFLTGTSLKILPIQKINDVFFNPSCQNLKLLIKSFENIINNNIKEQNTL